jgi:hypothetical protein
MTPPFSRDHLRTLGFVGFATLIEVEHGAAGITRRPGVYAVLREAGDHSTFLDASVGGHFKRRDPSLPPERLAREWVEGAETLYIGRARDLRRRLDQFARFGRGEPIGHWGGRLIWQLADHRDLVVAWLPASDFIQREADLIAEFVDAYGRLPFANLNRPRELSR